MSNDVEIKYSALQLTQIASMIKMGSELVKLLSDPKKISNLVTGVEDLQALVAKSDEVRQAQADVLERSIELDQRAKLIAANDERELDLDAKEAALKNDLAGFSDAKKEFAVQSEALQNQINNTIETQGKLEKAIEQAQAKTEEANQAAAEANAVKKEYKDKLEALLKTEKNN